MAEVEAIRLPCETAYFDDWKESCKSARSLSAIFFDRETQEAWTNRPVRQVASAAAIVLRNQECPPGELIAQFREVLFWPCDDEELRLRIERFVDGQVPEGDPDPDPADMEMLRSNLIGRSESFERVLKQVREIAGYDVTVLVKGETGTGKELIARALHYLSHRRDGPFVAVNCGAIPESLFENELFGHERGAYTDARNCQKGRVVEADGGTLFLDEIDTLTLRSQAALLRFLETRKYSPLGGRSSKQVDVRIVAAANVCLSDEVSSGRFRNDVLYRLDTLSIQIPPLRERDGDAVLLAEHFMAKYSDEYRVAAGPLSPTAMAWISGHSWPGNVREVQNRIQKALLLDEAAGFDLDEASSAGIEERFADAKARAIKEFERAYLERMLQCTRGNLTRAARISGKDRSALGKLLKKYNIDWRRYRT